MDSVGGFECGKPSGTTLVAYVVPDGVYPADGVSPSLRVPEHRLTNRASGGLLRTVRRPTGVGIAP